MTAQDERIATYRQEAFDLRTASLDHLRRIDQMLGIGAVFVATVATVAVKHRELMLGIPSAVFFLIALVTQVYTDVVVVDRARAAAEDALERELQAPATFYGRLAQPYRSGRYLSSVIAIGAVGTVIALAASVGGGLISADIHLHHDPISGHTVLCAYILATGTLALAALLAAGDFLRARRDALAAYSSLTARAGGRQADRG